MRAGPWNLRVALALTVLAAAAFVYVTAELMPVGALPAIAADLGVGEAVVGTLLGGYALVAAVATVPLVRATAHWPRRRVLLLSLVFGCLVREPERGRWDGAVSHPAPGETLLQAALMLLRNRPYVLLMSASALKRR